MRRWAPLPIDTVPNRKPDMNPANAVISQDPEVIVFNLKERYTGVSATINARRRPPGRRA